MCVIFAMYWIKPGKVVHDVEVTNGQGQFFILPKIGVSGWAGVEAVSCCTELFWDGHMQDFAIGSSAKKQTKLPPFFE